MDEKKGKAGQVKQKDNGDARVGGGKRQIRIRCRWNEGVVGMICSITSCQDTDALMEKGKQKNLSGIDKSQIGMARQLGQCISKVCSDHYLSKVVQGRNSGDPATG